MQALLKQRRDLIKRLQDLENKRATARKKLKWKEAADWTGQIRQINKQIKSIDDRLKAARKAAEVIADAKLKATKARAKAKIKEARQSKPVPVKPTLAVLRNAGMVPATEVQPDRPVRMAQGIPNAPVTEADAEAYLSQEAEAAAQSAGSPSPELNLPAPIVEAPWYMRPVTWFLGVIVMGGIFLFTRKSGATTSRTTTSSTTIRPGSTARAPIAFKAGQTRVGA